MQQIDVMSKARLCLSLRAPEEDATLEEKQQHYDEQRERILNFVNLLNDTMHPQLRQSTERHNGL
jgi:hypothetical protein